LEAPRVSTFSRNTHHGRRLLMSSPDGHIGGSGDPLLGQTFLDRYRIVRKLEARSGAGVYLAQNLHADRPVSVEVVETARADAAAVDQFLEESRTLARIGHENVVEIFNGGRSGEGAVFLAMEVLEGTSLGQVLDKEGPLMWDRAQGIVLQIAAALGAVHRHGVVHGDLRPENVLFVPHAGRRDFVKLLDFGVARLTTGDGSAPAAPAVDHRGDVYGLGCLAYQIVTGRPPFPSREGETPAAPSSLRPGGTLPADLDGVVLRALEKDPDKRWPDMAAFSDAVSRCRLTRRQSVRVEALAIAELSGKTGAFEADARRRRRVRSIVSVMAGVAIAIAVLRVLTTSPGHVQISTVPTDAELTFNGMPVQARSPVVLDAAPGRYTLVVSRAGYLTAERIVEVSARETVSLPVQLVAAPPAAALRQPAPVGGAEPAPVGAVEAAPAAAAAPAPAP
jgi:protein kinase-like protein/PEGA domain-containing protein